MPDPNKIFIIVSFENIVFGKFFSKYIRLKDITVADRTDLLPNSFPINKKAKINRIKFKNKDHCPTVKKENHFENISEIPVTPPDAILCCNRKKYIPKAINIELKIILIALIILSPIAHLFPYNSIYLNFIIFYYYTQLYVKYKR